MNGFGTISRLLGPRVLQRVLLALLVIESIFIAESLTGLLERVLRSGGASWHVIAILLLTSPEIFDFALPLALMIGVYVALIASREDSEFIVCSAAGASWRRIPGFILFTGVAGMLASVIVSGYVGPLAAWGKRVMILDLQTTQIREQISDTTPRDTLRDFAGRTFIATSDKTAGESRGRLFIRHPPEGDGWRVTQAQDWTTVGPDANGTFVVTFANVLDYAFANITFGQTEGADTKSDRSQDIPLNGANAPRFSAIGADTVSLPISLDKVIDAADRLRQDREINLTELAGAVAAGAGGASVDALESVQRRAGELLGRAILCPIACLFGLVAMIAARGGISRYAALPAAGVGVLAFDTLSRPILSASAQQGAVALFATGIALLVACAVPLLIAVAIHGERIIRPADGRA